MQNNYQQFENPDDNKSFYLALNENNIPNKINLNDFLKENYKQLYQLIKDNKKLSDNDKSFFLFKEILYEDNIIGYACYSLLDEFEDNNILILDNYYLPEDYNYSLIIDDMIETGFTLGFQIIIKYPTRKFIEALIETEFAYRIDNKIVFSEIAFMSDTVSLNISMNKVIDEIDLSQISTSYTISSLYDLELCAVVTLTEKLEVYDNQQLNDDNINDYCSISIALREDENEYSCINKRRKNKLLKKNKYFINVNDILTKYEQKHN